MRDFELHLETEKLDVDFSHGDRLLSRATGSARKHAETISTGADKDTREGMTAGMKHLLRSVERAMGMEDGTKKGQLQRRSGQTMAEWVNVFEKAVLDMKAEKLNVDLKSKQISKRAVWPWRDKNVCWGPLKANTSLLPFEGR